MRTVLGLHSFRRPGTALAGCVLSLLVLSGCSDQEPASGDPRAGGASSAPSAAAGSTDAPAPQGEAQAPGATTEYCRLLRTDLASVFGSVRGPDDVTEAVDMISRIGRAAPAEVRPQWRVMEAALDRIKGALREAARLQQRVEAGEIGQRELARKSQELTRSMRGLDTARNERAGSAVAEHAADYCGVAVP